jgi:hypothetical protein
VLASDTFAKKISVKKKSNLIFLRSGIVVMGRQNFARAREENNLRVQKSQYSPRAAPLALDGDRNGLHGSEFLHCTTGNFIHPRHAPFLFCVADLPSRMVTRGRRTIKLFAYLSYRASGQVRRQACVLGFRPYRLTIT